MASWAYDAAYRLTSPFGMRLHPISKTYRFHRGVDLVASPGHAPLFAFAAGIVMHAKHGAAGSGIPAEMGIVVAVKDDEGYLHLYAHLSEAKVKVGQRIERGQLIGLQGSTGSSTGNHLHYEIRKSAAPYYGWTATEEGVVEPTAYLQQYDKKKGGEPMTPVEKAAFETLTRKVAELEARASLSRIPSWARHAAEAAQKAGIVDTIEGGSYDFYRILTIIHRKGLI